MLLETQLDIIKISMIFVTQILMSRAIIKMIVQTSPATGCLSVIQTLDAAAHHLRRVCLLVHCGGGLLLLGGGGGTDNTRLPELLVRRAGAQQVTSERETGRLQRRATLLHCSPPQLQSANQTTNTLQKADGDGIGK